MWHPFRRTVETSPIQARAARGAAESKREEPARPSEAATLGEPVDGFLPISQPTPGDGLAVPFHYEGASNPHAITLLFNQGETPWTFGRGLLEQGLVERSGEGDVVVQPAPGHPDYLQLTFRSPTRTGAVYTSKAAVEKALESTYASVPQGMESEAIKEHLDLELELLRLTEGEGPFGSGAR